MDQHLKYGDYIVLSILAEDWDADKNRKISVLNSLSDQPTTIEIAQHSYHPSNVFRIMPPA